MVDLTFFFVCLGVFLFSHFWTLKKAEAYQWEQCIELLKAMLKLDADERITSSEVLTHPFFASHPFQGELSSTALRAAATIPQSRQL